MKFSLSIVAAMLFTLTACKNPSATSTSSSPASSAIVQKVEAAGSGDLSQSSEPALKQWMQGHPDVAQQTQKDCEPVQASAKASWYDTTEGRVCQAAQAAGRGGHMGPMGAMSDHKADGRH